MTPVTKILVVDDNHTNLAIMQEIFDGHYELKSATSGKECLVLADRFLPDLILLDIMMPGIDGYETCRRLRRNPNLPHTKIIMVSAKAMLSERLAGYEAGADDYLTKPFEEQELLSKVRVYMRLKSVEETNQLTEELNGRLDQTNRTLKRANERLEAEILRRRNLEDQLRHDALHDVLTSLPNRALLSDRIDHCLLRMKREDDYLFAVLFLDLDDFKVINDSLGHQTGDRVLIEIGHRLVSCIRSADCTARVPVGTIARLGGDEFVILLDGIRELTDALYVADRIRQVVFRALFLDGDEMKPRVSIGIATGGPNYEQAEEVLRDADTALYWAKERGKDCYAVFDAEMRHHAVTRLRRESALRTAIERDQLFLEYQPIVCLASGEIKGFEALVRWNHPEQGPIPPVEFIPLAEETGLIIPLGEWVLRKACQQTVAWKRRFPEYVDLSMSVNFSGKQFAAPDVVEQIVQILEETGLDQEYLNVELTETVLMRDASPEACVLEQLSARKIEVHMDDFGTGYSSLRYLTTLPISAVKLDRSFIWEMTSSKSDIATVRAVLELAHSRGLKVIAEGVETAEQATILRAMNCDLGQGYYFSRPVDADVTERMLASDGGRIIPA